MESSALNAWESFYVILGSSAAALTGLQFVVITLIAGGRVRHTQREINAFGTPVVAHFSVVLLVSSILSAPWRLSSDPARWIIAIAALGILYAVVTRLRARAVRQLPGAYQPVLEDLIWFQFLPSAGYVVLLGAGVALYRGHEGALRTIAGLMLFLLLVSIRNAWDTVTWIAETHSKES
ncbi:MAG TPA: hypothetical protein VG454_04885 [Gemmatimonadales bacterium]|nr:hypothetical protein [Gemmatimonadales bacterium]